MMYIWAWQAAGVAAEALIVSRISPPSTMPSPAPPYSCGNQRREIARLGQLVDELLRVLAPAVEVAPVLARVALAELGDAGLERPLLVGERQS